MNRKTELPPDLRDFEQWLSKAVPTPARREILAQAKATSPDHRLPTRMPALQMQRWMTFVYGCATGILLGVGSTTWLLSQFTLGHVALAERETEQTETQVQAVPTNEAKSDATTKGSLAVMEPTGSPALLHSLSQFETGDRVDLRSLNENWLDQPLRVGTPIRLDWADEFSQTLGSTLAVGPPTLPFPTGAQASKPTLTPLSKLPLHDNEFNPRG